MGLPEGARVYTRFCASTCHIDQTLVDSPRIRVVRYFYCFDTEAGNTEANHRDNKKDGEEKLVSSKPPPELRSSTSDEKTSTSHSEIAEVHKVNSIGVFHSPVYLSEGLNFRGTLDTDRFIHALGRTLEDFSFLFGEFVTRQRDLYCVVKAHKAGSFSRSDTSTGTSLECTCSCLQTASDGRITSHIALEIEHSATSMESPSNGQLGELISRVVPTQVDERIRNVFAMQLAGLPLLCLKVTTYTDGFAVGCYFNHALLDQGSIYYFFKYLSQVYTSGVEALCIRRPYVFDMDVVTGGNAIPEKLLDLEQFRATSEEWIGFTFLANDASNPDGSSASEESASTPDLKPDPRSYETLTLEFHLSTMEVFIRRNSSTYLSPNDLIHAVLLKLYSMNPEIPEDYEFCFGFACNVRKYCSVGEEAMGNVLSHPLLRISIKELRHASLLQLARMNRNRLSELNTDFICHSLAWYQALQYHHEHPGHYGVPSNVLNARATNWSTFNYDSIRFDASRPCELLVPCLAPFRVNVISFATRADQRVLRTTVSVPTKARSQVEELASTSGFFTSWSHAR